MIFLILSDKILNVIIEYITSLNKNINNSEIIIYPNDKLNEINEKHIYIYFGIYYVNYLIINKKNIYYVNLEQLTMNGNYSSFNMLTPALNIINSNKNINMCDYSQGNISILNDNNIKSLYLPYQVNNDEIFTYEKIYNFAVCCSWNSRIETIYNKITEKFDKCNSIGKIPKWGIERDNILFKTKVLANIHHREFDYNILEEIRITRCILNKIIVISEYSLEYEKYPLHEYVIFIDYEKMSDKIIDVLNNYDYYYYNIYSNFDIKSIHLKLKNYLNFLNN